MPNPMDPLTLNRYAFVNGNPLRYADPSGHCPECVLIEGGEELYGAAETAPEWVPAAYAAAASAVTGLAVVVEQRAQAISASLQSVGDSVVAASSDDETTNVSPSVSGEPASTDPQKDPQGNTVGPLEGAKNYEVRDPNNKGRTITDIDLIQGNTLWENKSAAWATDTSQWVQDNIVTKFNRYMAARNVLPGYYRNATIGFRFEDLGPGSAKMSPELRQAIEEAIQQLRAEHPHVVIEVDWGQ